MAGYFSTYGALLAYVEQGLAVALLPALAVDGRYDVQQRDLAAPSTRQMELLARPSASSRMAIQKIIDALLARAPT